MKKNNIYDLFFIIIVMFLLGYSFFHSILFTTDINNYENRTAYKYKVPTINTILNKEFQDNIELTLADQIPAAIQMKKIYNVTNIMYSKTFSNILFKNKCNNRYISISDDLVTYGCDNNLVYKPEKIGDGFEARMDNINKVIKSNVAEVFVYFIEKDTEINFETNKKVNFSNKIKENIKTSNFAFFEINNFDEFKDKFYKTDHHWNYKGSYSAYKQLVEFLGLKNPIKPGNIECIDKFTGSKANFAGALFLYNEEFCVYNFDIPKHITYINGKEVNDYGLNNINDLKEKTYGEYYGGDSAELIFDYNQPKKENILIIGESYDNAILKLLASHYNKTYSIDLRHYSEEFGKNFDYKKYVKENDIDKVLLIGNSFYYYSYTFNLEV